MTLIDLSTILRVVVYLWVGIEGLFLAYVYLYGYLKYRNSPVIRSLQRMFLSIGLSFMAFSFLPLLRYTNVVLYDMAINYGIVLIPVAALGYHLQKFRFYSLANQSKGESNEVRQTSQ
jgi:hypothetical protein